MTHHLTAASAHALTLAERVDLETNDEDNAARILSVFGDSLVFVSGRGWAVWDGTRYSLRSGGLAAREIGHKLRALVLEEAAWAAENYEPPEWQVDKLIEEAPTMRPPRILTQDGALFAIRQAKAAELRKHAVKCGYDAKVLRKLIALRKRDPDEMREEETILALYKQAIGM